MGRALGEGLGQGPTTRSRCSLARAQMEITSIRLALRQILYRRALQQPGCDASLPHSLRSPSGGPLMCYAGLWDLWLQKLPPIFRHDSTRLDPTQHNTTQYNTCTTTKQYKERGCRTETETSFSPDLMRTSIHRVYDARRGDGTSAQQ
jgi:hypothetical protein